ncbi:hypothetical protein K461DRAFT_272459 [Myriangium duriaei CBS 260.36]|uniref:F-box domain-containing protein n=1 Tax=Myriangium duriaei CBS 260.36 TaxID=1168546 RepID=A0A9P4MCF0_9PEZI|nr:hypothetical protein K461DRAFT_272459 [Myriangium duriaei CBS 260.36]
MVALNPLPHEPFLEVFQLLEGDGHTMFQAIRVTKAWYKAGLLVLWRHAWAVALALIDTQERQRHADHIVSLTISRMTLTSSPHRPGVFQYSLEIVDLTIDDSLAVFDGLSLPKRRDVRFIMCDFGDGEAEVKANDVERILRLLHPELKSSPGLLIENLVLVDHHAGFQAGQHDILAALDSLPDLRCAKVYSIRVGSDDICRVLFERHRLQEVWFDDRLDNQTMTRFINSASRPFFHIKTLDLMGNLDKIQHTLVQTPLLTDLKIATDAQLMEVLPCLQHLKGLTSLAICAPRESELKFSDLLMLQRFPNLTRLDLLASDDESLLSPGSDVELESPVLNIPAS